MIQFVKISKIQIGDRRWIFGKKGTILMEILFLNYDTWINEFLFFQK